MSTYIDFFQDFLQKKETVGRRESAVSLPDEDRDEGQSVLTDITVENSKKMEHSYTRDNTSRSTCEVSTGLAPARTILVRKPPQCPSCHTHPMEEHDLNDGNQAVIPSYNEIAAKEAMNECARIAKYVKNVNSDDVDWEVRICRNGWTSMQKSLYEKVVSILDNDHLGRLANFGKQNEVMQRRVITDKSASRMRKALASVAWDCRLTQWMHSLLMDHLPPSYMASYLDILQTLKSKVPSLVDKLLFMRPLNNSQELLAPVMKTQWEPVINVKGRILTQDFIILVLPSLPYGTIPRRIQKFSQHLSDITKIVEITLPSTGGHTAQQPLDQVAEQIVSLTRVKIQELRHESPLRSIILVGYGAGSALALQVAMSESVAAVVCLGFAYHTLKGVRGKPDDRILDLKMPILFVIGQNSQRSSTEEMEYLRERMQSESSLVIVGSADDMLRVPKSRRKIENVTQSMVDTMIIDEVYGFLQKILTNPPGPRIPTTITSLQYNKQNKGSQSGETKSLISRKRKQDAPIDNESTSSKVKFSPQKPTSNMKRKPQELFQTKRKVGRPRTRPMQPGTPATKTTKIINSSTLQHTKTDLPSTTLTNDDLNMAIQSILQDPEAEDTVATENSQKKPVTNFELHAQSKSAPAVTNVVGTKIRMIPPNQFMQLKPPLQSQSKIYTIKASTNAVTQQNTTNNIGAIVSTSSSNSILSGQQPNFFTIKTNCQTSQYLTASPPLPPQKYTVVKNASGETTLQLTKNVTATNQCTVENSNVDMSNIIDMPIIFADNDGNIADAVTETSDTNNKTLNSPQSSKPNVGQLIINQKIIKEIPTTTSSATIAKGGTFVIGRSATSSQAAGFANNQRILLLNRSTMKPCSSIITRPATAIQKFPKVVVANPKVTCGTTIGTRPNIILKPASNNTSIVSTVKQLNLQTLKNNVGTTGRPTSGILNVSTKSLPQLQIINATSGSNSSTISTNVSSLVTNTAITALGDRPQIRNIVTVKPGGLKQITPQLSSQLLNRNLTVRKLVNIVPVTKTATIVTGGSNVTINSPVNAQIITETADPLTNANSNTTSVTAIQSAPKIFTLNPLNANSTSTTINTTTTNTD